MSYKKYTIKDIAKMAGVSMGTVDRVLHKRGKVSEKAFAKVDKVLQEINFIPNPIARNLKINKVYRICVLVPDAEIDPYWVPANKGLYDAANEFRSFGIAVEQYYYHPNERSTFIEKSKEIIDSKPDALLMAPLFHKESLIISKECKNNNIYLTLFNNLIDNTLNTDYFIGQDLYQTGRVAASLIDKITQNNANIAIIHINEEPHMRQKEIGFKDYFKEKLESNHKIVTYNLSTESLDDFEKDVNLFFDSYPLVSGIFITNSMAYKLATHIAKKNKKIYLVGYDLLHENISFMKKGHIDFLIHQKPKKQAHLAVSLLADHFLFNKKIPIQDLLPIDIVTTENIKYYLSD